MASYTTPRPPLPNTHVAQSVVCRGSREHGREHIPKSRYLQVSRCNRSKGVKQQQQEPTPSASDINYTTIGLRAHQHPFTESAHATILAFASPGLERLKKRERLSPTSHQLQIERTRTLILCYLSLTLSFQPLLLTLATGSAMPSLSTVSLQTIAHDTTMASSSVVPDGQNTSSTAEALLIQNNANGTNHTSHIHPPSANIAIPRSLTLDTMDLAANGEPLSYPEDLCPPDNFNMVSTWIYRSSFPKKKNFSFLKKLGLKSVL